ncbi:aspartate kinase [Paenibacillus psychroresistens]|uniref:Aspartokinase n=1 Tax=Paenibacillus psychroresistens TaxID=1778678 RepID=A0A6B8RKK5_9BACL|nr:aspartate kinase [Paenibacillus psychroresistens]QGQ96284.1 aspartate kinase [Paenibacillus psychroresistens]
MRILVQKFGGTSLSSVEARIHVINHIKRALVEAFNLVIVVSAMGRRGDPYATDTLLDWVGLNGNQLSPRERDMILCCGETISAVTLCSLLNAEHIEAAVLNGEQAGITTNDRFGNAQILSINPQRILDLLKQQKVVIVTGFQGATVDHDFTTLGRGGSDTTATALGVALNAEIVDIFTDVDGVLTADPRIVEDAKPLSYVTFNEICHLAHHGAKVIHPRAVEIAMQANLPVRIRSTFTEGTGTLVASLEALKLETNTVIDRYVTGIAYVPSLTQLTVLNGEGQYDTSLHVFKAMAQHKISVDFINVNPMGVIYTVFESDAALALEALEPLGYHVKSTSHCAKVSVIGGGMNEVPGIMANIVEALMDADITILQSSDSHTTIWVLVNEVDMVLAVRTLHAKFKLAV